MEAMEIKKGKNPFIFDGGIGRITLLKTIISAFTISLLVFILCVLYAQDASQLIIRTRLLPCIIIFLLFTTYVLAIAYIKRLYHIIADKRKAVFYIVSLYIAIPALAFIQNPITAFLSKVLPWLAFIALLTIPGKNKLC